MDKPENESFEYGGLRVYLWETLDGFWWKALHPPDGVTTSTCPNPYMAKATARAAAKRWIDRKGVKGFTLIELLVVIAIIGILAFAILGGVRQLKHGGCAQYRNTGSQTCTGDASYTHCTPDQECVLYGDGTRP